MKIIAVGMNYAEHNNELDPTFVASREPVIFTKADSSLLKSGKPFFIPEFTKHCDYETELVIRICRLGKNIAPRFAHRYYDAVTVGIDFTARDLQDELRKKGLSWELSKAFDNSAAVGEFITVDKLPPVQELKFSLQIDGKTVQEGNAKDMLTGVDDLIAYISRFFTLKIGDLIFTGTPVGAGPVTIGQRLEGFLEGEKLLELNIK